MKNVLTSLAVAAAVLTASAAHAADKLLLKTPSRSRPRCRVWARPFRVLRISLT